MSEAAHGCKLLVDGVCRQTTGFEEHAVANDHDAIEGQPGLGAVPGDELIDGVLVNAARGWKAEAIEDCQFAMIQIRQTKHSATVIRFNSLFAHSHDLPCRRIGTTADRLDDASVGKSVRVWRVLGAIA
jgi:hypothetical protein